jgi:hypothetical protein
MLTAMRHHHFLRSLATLAVLGATTLLPAAGAPAPLYADATLERYFALDWQATGGPGAQTIGGFVVNRGNIPVERMRLAVDRLDASGAATGTSDVWVVGVVPPNNRTYFTASVPGAATYRVRVVSFDWVNCRD